MSDPIRIDRDELNDPKVDEVLSREAVFRGSWADGGDGEVVGKVRRRGGGGRGQGKGVYTQSVIATALLALFGSLAGWGLMEPYFFDDSPEPCYECSQELTPKQAVICDGCQRLHHPSHWEEGGEYQDPDEQTRTKAPNACGNCGETEQLQLNPVMSFFMIPLVVCLSACFLGMADGLLARAWTRALIAGAISFAVGLVGALIMVFVAGFLFVVTQGIMETVGSSMSSGPQPDRPVWFVIGLISCRSAAWSVFGLATGLAPGLLQRSRDLVAVGILGGVLGGFMGGLFFDPIGLITGGGEVSRAFGFGFMGFVTGLGIGLVEQLSKDAWLYMEEGPLVGKQFVLYKDPTKIGSSPKCDIFVFKDPDISPEHAYLRRVGATHEIESVGGAPVIVNGKRVGRQRLEDGDQIRVGKASFRYYVRKKKKKKIG